MARDHVACSRIGCRSAAEWIAWYPRSPPLALCYRCLKSYYRAEGIFIYTPLAVPLLVGIN